MSLGVSASFLTGETASSWVSYSPPVAVPAAANLRMMTVATVSKTPVAADTKKREPRGIMKPRRVSPEMQAFLGGVSEIPRTQVLKHIWAYIKQHNLQASTLLLHVIQSPFILFFPIYNISS